MSRPRSSFAKVVLALCAVMCCLLPLSCHFGQERVDFEVVVNDEVIDPVFVEGLGEEMDAHYTVTELGSFIVRDRSVLGRGWGEPRWIIDGTLAGQNALVKTVFTLREERRAIMMCRKDPYGKEVCVEKYVTTDLGGRGPAAAPLAGSPEPTLQDTTTGEATDPAAMFDETVGVGEVTASTAPQDAGLSAPFLSDQHVSRPERTAARSEGPSTVEPAASSGEGIAFTPTTGENSPSLTPVPTPVADNALVTPPTIPPPSTTEAVDDGFATAPAAPPVDGDAPLTELSRSLTVGPKLANFSPSCGEFVTGPVEVSLRSETEVELRGFSIYTQGCGKVRVTLRGGGFSESTTQKVAGGPRAIALSHLGWRLRGGVAYSFLITTELEPDTCGPTKRLALGAVGGCGGGDRVEGGMRVGGERVVFDLGGYY